MRFLVALVLILVPLAGCVEDAPALASDATGREGCPNPPESCYGPLAESTPGGPSETRGGHFIAKAVGYVDPQPVPSQADPTLPAYRGALVFRIDWRPQNEHPTWPLWTGTGSLSLSMRDPPAGFTWLQRSTSFQYDQADPRPMFAAFEFEVPPDDRWQGEELRFTMRDNGHLIIYVSEAAGSYRLR